MFILPCKLSIATQLKINETSRILSSFIDEAWYPCVFRWVDLMVNHFGSTSRTWSVPWMAANAGHRCSARFVAKTSCMVITYDSCHACTGMVHGVVATPLCPLKMMWIFFSKMVCPACTRWMNWLVVCTRHFLSTMKYIKMSSWVAKKSIGFMIHGVFPLKLACWSCWRAGKGPSICCQVPCGLHRPVVGSQPEVSCEADRFTCQDANLGLT